MLVNDAAVCTLRLSSEAATGTCNWQMSGLAPGEYRLAVQALDEVSAETCTARYSDENLDRRREDPFIVVLEAAAPTVTRQPLSVTVAEQASATFSVQARGSGPYAYRWQRSTDAGATFVDIAGADEASFTTPAVQAGDDGQRFRVVVSNSAGTVTSAAAVLTVLAADCPAPLAPAAYDTSAPPGGASRVATYGTNLLVDGGFEGSVRVGFSPDGFGHWRFDQAVTIGTARQGIAPRGSGARMLHFVGTGRADDVRGTSSEQVQLVDVSALAADIDNGLVQVDVSAWFSRVAGCAQTDDSFGIAAIAFDGPPTTYPQRVANGVEAATEQGTSRDAADVSGVDAWLRYRTFGLRHNRAADRQGDVYGWRQGGGSMDLPVGTRFVAMFVYAAENVANDAAFPELHGHYADDATLVLSRR